MCEAARRAWLEAVDRFPGNPSSPHRLGARADRALSEARERLATCLGVGAQGIVWTSGATESNNLLLHHVARTNAGEVWISAVEHPCVLSAARHWLPERHRLIPVTSEGDVDLDWIENGLRKQRPALVGVMAANNETGVVTSWQSVARACREHGVPFFTDAAQAIGKSRDTDMGTANYFSGCAHKFGGPPGVGFLRTTGPLAPLFFGGPQEDGRRPGTENVPGAIACAAALEQRLANLQERRPGERAAARDRFEEALAAAIPGIQIIGRAGPRLWNTSAMIMPPVDCQRRWVVRLDKRGFAVSTGSACSSGSERMSHVLEAMKLDGSGERMLRVSGGWETPDSLWTELAGAIIETAMEFGN
jgi:cysteine desulfurase